MTKRDSKSKKDVEAESVKDIADVNVDEKSENDIKEGSVDEKLEGGTLQIQKKHISLIVAGLVLFSAGFAVNSLSNYLSSGEPSQATDSGQESASGGWNPFEETSVSKAEIGNRALAYISNEFLTPRGAEGELVEVEEYGDNIYIVNLRIQKDGLAQETSVYVTKDGKLLLLGDGGVLVDLPKTNETAPKITITPQEQTPSQTTPQDAGIGLSDAAYVSGPENATVIMIEFSDYQCPFCKRYNDQTLNLILENYGSRIRYVIMDFPLNSIHPQAFITHVAARCAGAQDKYFEYHDKLFTNQQVWSRFAPESAEEISELKKYSEELGLDKAAFDECLDSKRYAEDVLNNLQKGLNAGVTGTPAFFINGRLVSGAQPYSTFQQILDAELAHE